jgi:hypothetical protein
MENCLQCTLERLTNVYCTFLQACRWYGSFPDRLVILLDGVLVYQESTLNLYYIVYTVKKVIGFPVPSQDVTYQTLPVAGNNLIIPV